MSQFIRITEQDSEYRHLEKMSTLDLLSSINQEDNKVASAVQQKLGAVEQLVDAVVDKMLQGGRLFYIGAGTSGRLAVVDASECPPTYGVPPTMVIAIIAGGIKAMTEAVENAEDDVAQGWKDLLAYNINENDFVIGLTASGTTPYVIAALKICNEKNIETGCITCNENTPVGAISKFPIEVVVGPEFVTGSTRMKSGTAQKLLLNMISTSVMIKLGRVEDNKMVNMQLTNDKLVDRGVQMLMKALPSDNFEATKLLLLKHGSVKKAIEANK